MLNTKLTEASRLFAAKYSMTPREAEVLNLFLEGLTPETVATRLGLSLNTIRNHVKGMLRGTQTNAVNLLLAKFIREAFESPF
jgi:DNA-binding CsgD family transcriptional regulator